MARLRFKARVLVGLPGAIEGDLVVYDSLSFYGEVDPKTGRSVDGRSLRDKVVAIRRSRGSTVGSYIIYGLKESGVAPKAIVMGRAEPIVITGCVLSEVPLLDGAPDEFFEKARDEDRVRIYPDGTVELL